MFRKRPVTINKPSDRNSHAERDHLSNYGTQPELLCEDGNNPCIHDKACHAGDSESDDLRKVFTLDHCVVPGLLLILVRRYVPGTLAFL